MARAAEQAAIKARMMHVLNCGPCAVRAKSHQADPHCAEGKRLRAEEREAKAALAESKRLDKLTAPGQGTLFTGEGAGK
jgi:hypothetical protein